MKVLDDIQKLIEMPLYELLALADKIRSENVGGSLELCSIYNAKSGLCAEDCKFCAQASRHHTGAPIYPLKNQEEMLNAALTAKKIGASKFGIVTSGNKLNPQELRLVTETVTKIKEKTGLSVCASLGALSLEELKTLKKAGLHRYHHNIETSPRFYPQVVSTHSFQERVNTIKAAQDAGLEACSGGIIGLGETWQDRIDMAMLLKEMDVDSVPINVLVPIPGTPYASASLISCGDAVRTIALFRIILPNKIIKIAAGRETVLKDFQALVFMSGANGMIIGGYLTIKGRAAAEDQTLVQEIKRLWAA